MSEHQSEQAMEGVVRDAVLVQEREPCPDFTTEDHPRGDRSRFVVVREGYRVHELEGPRERRRGHHFDDLDTFAGWLTRKAEAKTTELFVSATEVQALLDPDHLEPEQVRCDLLHAPEVAAFRAVLGKPLPLRQLHDLVRSFRRFLPESEALLSELRTITVSGSDELHTQIDETGALRVTASNGRRDVSGRIPPEIVLRTRFYQGLRYDPFDVELLVQVSLDPLAFTLSCPAWELAVAEGRTRVRAQLVADLGDDFTVALGTTGLHSRKARA